jgi:lysozyme family protein
LGIEGGFSNHPNDRGGATNFGITKSTYTNWLREQGRDRQSVRNINEQEVQDIYRTYWEDTGADQLPWPLSDVVFDAGVNSGPTRAITQLQEAAGAVADGRMGPDTLRAVSEHKPQELAQRFMDIRADFYETIARNRPDQRAFIRGWRNRVRDMRDVIEGEAPEGTTVVAALNGDDAPAGGTLRDAEGQWWGKDDDGNLIPIRG